jgi:membrane protein CcdC involved in cytochrome C biogenesis
MNSTDASENAPGDRIHFPVSSSKTFVVILLIYLGLHTLIRTLISDAVALDEPEHLYLTEKSDE